MIIEKMKSALLFILLGTMCFLSSCKKDYTTLKIRLEQYSDDSKIHLNDYYAVWDDGDMLMINGEAVQVNIVGENASITVPTSDSYVAVYPHDFCTSMVGTDIALSIPRVQAYETRGANQIVKALMVGKTATGSNRLLLLNRQAVLAITVNNDIDDRNGYVIDSIKVESVAGFVSLWGTANMDITEQSPSLNISNDAANRTSIVLAKVVDNQQISLDIATTNENTLYLSIPPILASTGNRFSISLYGHTSNGHYKFTKAQTGAQTVDIEKNQIVEIPFMLSQAQETTLPPEGAIDGIFSVSQYTKVFFSKGNLECVYATSSSSTWRFHENQYEMLNEYRPYPMDLFFWGNRNQPHINHPSSLNSWSADADWGSHPITNGGNTRGLWRTLSMAEWQYLLGLSSGQNRTFGTHTGQGHCYQLVKVREKNGLLIFPDNFSDQNQYPAGCELSYVPNGCCFLPVTGYVLNDSRRWLSYGYYWTSTISETSQQAQCFKITPNSTPNELSFESRPQAYQHAVRLVQNVPSDSK